jgi:hypothetical protein
MSMPQDARIRARRVVREVETATGPGSTASSWGAIYDPAMPRTPIRLLLAASAVALVLAGCGTSSGSDAAGGTTTTKAQATTTAASEVTDTTEAAAPTETTAPAEDDICVPLKVLSDYDIASARLIAVGDWTAIQAYFVEKTDAVLAAYDDAIAIDSEVTDDLKELRTISEGTAELAADATDLMDLSGKLTALPGLQSAGAAGERLNAFAEEKCGFSTGGNGQ